MSNLKEKRVELILQQLEELPTLPTVAVRVLEMTADDESSLRDVVRLIESDQSLTARILQLVHRADLGVRHVNSVERAVSLLGFDAVRSAVLAVTVFHAFGPSVKATTQFSRDDFWKHSIAVAVCAEMLAMSAGPGKGLEPSEAFVCGLLHDMGKVALDAVLPKSFERVVEAACLLRGDIADFERNVIGLDHMVVGKRLAERWQLPASIREAVWLHGQLPEALPASAANARLVSLITLSDMLVRERHLGFSGNFTFTVPRPKLLDAVGLTESQVQSVCKRLVEEIEPRAKALGLGEASSGELYQQALENANKELGRVSSQLAAKNRRLSVRSRFFDALAQFHTELRPDASPQAVLGAIGQTAASVLDVPVVAAFSVMPGKDWSEVMLFTREGTLFEDSLVECTSRPATPAQGDGPILPAGQELEWLLSAISPRLSEDQRYWICLQADGMCIGGVLWGAGRGEGERLGTQVAELNAMASGWGLALRMAQVREEARLLAENLADANRQLQSAQNEITRSKAMISLGELAAGAAHEMNNPLAVISGRSQLLASQLEDPRLKHAARQIFEQSHRLSQIITELMDFAKPQPPSPTNVDAAEIVERAVYEARNACDLADRRIEVTMGDTPLVHVDVDQVTASVREVVENAINATDERDGTITIHTAYEASSHQVVILVSDNGKGMDEATLKKAFDPFFSKRLAGRRRGMGLAKALRWVEASGGSIRLDSHLGQGTRAMILLPAVRGEVPAESVENVAVCAAAPET